MYTPTSGYVGSDSFTYQAGDGDLDSNVATVTIIVRATNQAPTADPQSVTTAEDTPKAITLTGDDPDGGALTYVLTSSPAHGALSGFAPNVTYTPAANFHGSDSFNFKVRDSSAQYSTPATIAITVTAVNDPPVAAAQSVTNGERTRRKPSR